MRGEFRGVFGGRPFFGEKFCGKHPPPPFFGGGKYKKKNGRRPRFFPTLFFPGIFGKTFRVCGKCSYPPIKGRPGPWERGGNL